LRIEHWERRFFIFCFVCWLELFFLILGWNGSQRSDTKGFIMTKLSKLATKEQFESEKILFLGATLNCFLLISSRSVSLCGFALYFLWNWFIIYLIFNKFICKNDDMTGLWVQSWQSLSTYFFAFWTEIK
jgi:hypothetical protein